SIKLIMTTNCHHQKLIRTKIVFRQFMNCELRFACRGVEDSIADSVWKIEAAWLAHACVVVVKPRYDSLNRIADLVVITYKIFPIDSGAVPKRGSRQPRHDLRLTEQLRRRRFKRATRDLNHAHRILGCNELW